MPPAGFETAFPKAKFLEYQPRTVTADDLGRFQHHQETLRVFQNTLQEIRQLAAQIAERFQQATEQTARIRAENDRLRQEMEITHRRIRMKARERAIRERERCNRTLKAFFSCKKRRQKFPELTRKYFKSIS